MTTKDSQETGSVKLEQCGMVAQLTLSRPHALNALTWEMYEQLEEYLKQLEDEPSVRVLVIRGDGDKALAAGTDIKQFQGFTGQDGIRYEQRIDEIGNRLVKFPKPTIAAVQGYAVGGGMLIAAGCDLRYATPKARFGAPMARTLGNCLSLTSYQRLVHELGVMRTKELLFTSRLISAEEAASIGFVTAILDDEKFFDHVMDVATQISKNAPLTIQASKEGIRRLQEFNQSLIPAHVFDDVIERVYGSQDFAEGVEAYIQKRSPQWRGE